MAIITYLVPAIALASTALGETLFSALSTFSSPFGAYTGFNTIPRPSTGDINC